MKYLTDSQAGQIPALGGLSREERDQALADADLLYAHINDHPWISDPDLREWAESVDLDPDRTTVALGLLSDTGRVVPIGQPASQTGSTA